MLSRIVTIALIGLLSFAGLPLAKSVDRIVIRSTGSKNVLNEVADAATRLGATSLKTIVYGDAPVAVATSLNVRAAAALQRRFGSSVAIEADILYSIDAKGGSKPPAGDPPPAPPQVIPWGITAIEADAAQGQTGAKGFGVTICIVDTGIDYSHPDLAANVIGGVNTISPRRSFKDDNGHGTHVAGTIAGIDNAEGILGVASAASLFGVKALDRNGSGWSSDLAEGIYACIDAGADAISMSWGSASPSSVIYDAVLAADVAGLVLVAAAGNNAGPVGYPAAFSEVIAVSAVDSNLDFATFSSFGPEVSYAAPGVGILSTYLGGQYAYLSGTSMACPHVSGVVALMIGSGSLGLIADDIGLLVVQQGNGLINALKTVTNLAP